LLAPTKAGGFGGVVADVAKLSVGREEYYTRELATDHEAYLSGHGESPGRWYGAGATSLGLQGEASVAGFQRMFEGRDPDTGEFLGRSHGKGAVPAFDVVLRPTKSVSVVYGLGDPATGRAVLEAHHAGWSPQQIAGWLPLAYPQDSVMRVSHETIYLSLFVQSRGALRRELQRCLRTGRAMRYPRGKRLPQGRGQLRDTLHISQRPAEAADRAVPGHWEGDLVFGKRPSAVGTLVERHSRYVLLFPLPNGFTAERMRPELTTAVLRLPEQLRRSLTWDQGREMAEHLQFTIDSGVQVYFCDPRSPWQRGTNENTNGLLRQYLPKGADLRQLDQAGLDAIAAELNGRPRQTLGFKTPSQVLAEALH